VEISKKEKFQNKNYEFKSKAIIVSKASTDSFIRFIQKLKISLKFNSQFFHICFNWKDVIPRWIQGDYSL
jgi:hypothetical protein